MFNKVIGTGGIGTGMFFNLEGNYTLGRDESRLGFLTDFKDYCKQHIILHYVSVLTGDKCKVNAIGLVGNDPQGEKLLQEMRFAGIETEFVNVTNDARTMLSICFQYPDKSGGNITTSNSASGLVTAEYIKECTAQFSIDNQTIVLAAPEVELSARLELMKLGKENGAFVAASLLSSEVAEFEKYGGFQLCDLLAINKDEAKAIAGIGNENNVEKIADLCAEYIQSNYSTIKLIVTCGSKGCFTYEKGNREFVPIIDVDVVSTAGAGDALLGGTLSGIAQGLSFQKGVSDMQFGSSPLKSAVEFGTIASTFAVMSPNSIAENASKNSICDFVKVRKYILSEDFSNAF